MVAEKILTSGINLNLQKMEFEALAANDAMVSFCCFKRCAVSFMKIAG